MGDRSSQGGISSPDRRKVLLALGFGAANVAALSRLTPTDAGPGRDPSGRRVVAGAGLVEPPALSGAPSQPAADHVYETVLNGGRVIDPDTGFDEIANVGIDGTTIAAVSVGPLLGRTSIDARDRVVSPGFIDILSYEPNAYGIWYKIADGVTTNLGMHGINASAADYFARSAAEGSPCHYGGAYDNPFMRGTGGLNLDSGSAASAPQIDELVADLRRQIADGWIGVDFEPEYTPGIEIDEMLALAQVAAEADVPCFFHGRYSDEVPPGTNADTLEEILRVGREAGVGVHVEHITSTGGTFSMDRSLATLAAALDEGIDISACMYPYTYWATFLASARFADGWQERFRISYDDLVIAGTGERLTEATFARYRRENLLAAAYAIPEADVRTALRSELVMIGSDAILEPDNNNHPRSAGCFARTLGHYVREERVLSLPAALAKMTIMPARRLERGAPALRRKGRLQRGADADITVFDPAAVGDRATLENPAQFSVGVDYVIVSGQVVQAPDGQNRDRLPGQPIRSGAG